MGSLYIMFLGGVIVWLFVIFIYCDVGNIDCLGNVVYVVMDEIWDIVVYFNDLLEELIKVLEGGVIY